MKKTIKTIQKKKKIGLLKKELIIRVLRLKNTIHFVLANRRGRPYGRKDKLGFLSKIKINQQNYNIICLYTKKIKKALSQGAYFNMQAYKCIL